MRSGVPSRNCPKITACRHAHACRQSRMAPIRCAISSCKAMPWRRRGARNLSDPCKAMRRLQQRRQLGLLGMCLQLVREGHRCTGSLLVHDDVHVAHDSLPAPALALWLRSVRANMAVLVRSPSAEAPLRRRSLCLAEPGGWGVRHHWRAEKLARQTAGAFVFGGTGTS